MIGSAVMVRAVSYVCVSLARLNLSFKRYLWWPGLIGTFILKWLTGEGISL